VSTKARCSTCSTCTSAPAATEAVCHTITFSHFHREPAKLSRSCLPSRPRSSSVSCKSSRPTPRSRHRGSLFRSECQKERDTRLPRHPNSIKASTAPIRTEVLEKAKLNWHIRHPHPKTCSSAVRSAIARKTHATGHSSSRRSKQRRRRGWRVSST